MQQLAVSVQATSNPTIASSVTIRSSGFHTQFVVSGLAASTNYTAWVAMSGNGVEMVSPPSYFATKSATYPCTLVHSLPYCPDVAYSIPLPPPAAAPFYTDANLPATLKSNLIGTIGNFTKSLGTFRCGHDLYSPITTCSECDRAYRKWACQVSLPRCSEASLSRSQSVCYGSFTEFYLKSTTFSSPSAHSSHAISSWSTFTCCRWSYSSDRVYRITTLS